MTMGSIWLGAGQTTTILQAAPGYENMLPVQIGLYQQPVNEDENALHRPQVTGVGILDSSVTSTKYGYRTLSVAPASASVNDRGPWVSGTAYNVNDLVTLNNGPNSASQTYLCTTANTAELGQSTGHQRWGVILDEPAGVDAGRQLRCGKCGLRHG